MKFGDTLQQRSVPQWQNYNIDYTALKRLIKQHTSPQAAARPGIALSIPGKGPTVQDEFDAQLFDLIRRECDRLDLFVKSKKYELASRLQSIERQINQLQQRRVLQQQQPLPSTRTALGLRRRFSKLESELLRVGEEIQNVSRFIVSNRMAVRKAVKKHRKWTRSPTFAARVDEQILGRDDCFARVDLSTVMEQYASYLGDLRSAFEEHHSPDKSSPSLDTTNTSITLKSAPIDFDTLVEAESGPSRRATYWVHQDNVVELRILLLQYMRYAHLDPASPATKPKMPLRRDSSFLSDNQVGLVALDSSKISVRWAGNDAAVTVSDSGSYTTKFERHRLPSFLSASRPLDQRDSSDDLSSLPESTDKEREIIQAWMENHPNVNPLARVCANRSRFVSLEESAWPGPRAILDQEVRMEKTSIVQLRRKESFRPASFASMELFPHAVLTVVSGDDDGGIIAALDSTHLTERIPGFSIGLHAIATCCKPNALPEPAWLPKLSEDIRHLPPASDSSSRRSSNFEASSERTPAERKSRSATTPSAPEEAITPDASMPSAHENRRLGAPLATKIQPAPIRYWNEFDDGSEFGGHDDSYVIYVDPDEPVFPGLARFIAWQKNIYAKISKASSLSSKGRKKEQSTKDAATSEQAQARRPLVDGANPSLQSPLYYSTTDEDNEDTDALVDSADEVESPRSKRRHHRNEMFLRASLHDNYGTLPSSQRHANPPSLHRLSQPSLRTAEISLAASAIVTLLLGILSSTARKRARGEVSVAMILGVTASLLFAVFGVVSLLHAVSTVGEPRDIETLALLGAVVPAGEQISWQKKASIVGKWKVGLGFLIAVRCLSPLFCCVLCVFLACFSFSQHSFVANTTHHPELRGSPSMPATTTSSNEPLPPSEGETQPDDDLAGPGSHPTPAIPPSTSSSASTPRSNTTNTLTHQALTVFLSSPTAEDPADAIPIDEDWYTSTTALHRQTTLDSGYASSCNAPPPADFELHDRPSTPDSTASQTASSASSPASDAWDLGHEYPLSRAPSPVDRDDAVDADEEMVGFDACFAAMELREHGVALETIVEEPEGEESRWYGALPRSGAPLRARLRAWAGRWLRRRGVVGGGEGLGGRHSRWSKHEGGQRESASPIRGERQRTGEEVGRERVPAMTTLEELAEVAEVARRGW
ncbi:hypothetical protein FH972_026353 [Carpinus fangiana]|uniref:SPX domain-containing protein n=1 Tax=Carpinus fangiana TaxID=176857 RepID=A0A5N6L436_9ROSI|nr:hypothetical protein FH972_026353 [Carpinus fangiana]